jgi:hypothetical protein
MEGGKLNGFLQQVTENSAKRAEPEFRSRARGV